jgi:hypothetical protein
MLIDGIWHDNITCPRCKHRHPALLSCIAARELATAAQQERERFIQAQREVGTPAAYAVPDDCEHILWRGQVYALPLTE